MQTQNNSGAAMPFTILVTSTEVQEAWDWLLSQVNERPTISESLCKDYIYDHKILTYTSAAFSYKNTDQVKYIGYLYLASQLAGDPGEIEAIICGNAEDVGIWTPKLDESTRKLIENEDNFRDALSEHLAFWIQWTSLNKSQPFSKLFLSLPNKLPTDAGPDGLSLMLGITGKMMVELRSVKNSCAKNGPAYMIATKGFCDAKKSKKSKSTEADAKLQLEEFYKIIEEGYNFLKLNDRLSEGFRYLGIPPSAQVRAGLLRAESCFNAVVVANNKYGNFQIFRGYKRIARKPEEKTATYIGADDWIVYAENVRSFIRKILTNAMV